MYKLVNVNKKSRNIVADARYIITFVKQKESEPFFNSNLALSNIVANLLKGLVSPKASGFFLKLLFYPIVNNFNNQNCPSGVKILRKNANIQCKSFNLFAANGLVKSFQNAAFAPNVKTSGLFYVLKPIL